MASPEIKDSSRAALNNAIIKDASPESKCPICLDHFKNISYLNVCLHKFCFLCICEWSKNKAECPLCKQPFNSIYHSIKAENDYKRFDLRPTENGSFGNVAGQRFRYRTTLTGDHRPAPRRTSPPPDHGIIFESLSGPLPQRHNRDFHRMMRRLAARHRAETEGRSVQSLREQEVVKFRRALYRRGLRVQSVQDGGRTRETSAEFFRKNPACLHRLVPWLRRELTVLYGTHGSFVNILQHIIMTLITRHNLDDQAVLHELRPFLLSHTEHFLHEFLSFAQSPFNVEAYDRHAVYDLAGPSTESSSSETSVIAISEDESDSLVPGPQDFTTPRVSLSQTAWDDETPGPSYSLEPSQVFPFHVRDSDSDSSVEETAVSVAAVTHQDHTSGSDEDCVIVGYVKPMTERTPELIQLTSDSEESEENGDPQSPQPPQHIRFTSESPSVTQRPSGRSPEDTTRVHTSNRHRQRDKHDKRHHERELSREGSSRSNRTHSCSHSRNHSLSKDGTHKRRREKETSHNTSSYSHSYSQYKESCIGYYTETHSSYSSYYRNVYDCSRSRSRSRRQSKDRRDRVHSRSSSRFSSNSSIRQGRSHSRSSCRINTSQQDEYGRKRKYKTKHLEKHQRKSSGKSYSEPGEDCIRKKKKEKKHHKKSKKKSRSPSTDVECDDTSDGHSRKHHKKRKKHRRKSKRDREKDKGKRRLRRNSSDPITVTTDSQSDNTDPTLPSDRNVCFVRSTVVIADSARKTQQASAATECSSIGHLENHPPKD